MEISNIYTLEGEVTQIVKAEYPSVIDRIECMATEEDGLEKLKDKARNMVEVWRKVYFQDSRKMQMRFVIYKNTIVNNMILKDEPVFKNELKNY